ncbi:hypothetical protein CR205_14205 [Alteribacter lacisalsi]|uniref:Lipoprotein n=1 Tax=Alteribacter lacisalsi TaxID=2045244 RepID=A0A2W0HT87_9BACI|nr:hypothetical protein [Alteribacter lacisalsi]PYZ96828.1 hypothetical protein CR205_14205 [Alteribacter lacisalsi]
MNRRRFIIGTIFITSILSACTADRGLEGDYRIYLDAKEEHDPVNEFQASMSDLFGETSAGYGEAVERFEEAEEKVDEAIGASEDLSFETNEVKEINQYYLERLYQSRSILEMFEEDLDMVLTEGIPEDFLESFDIMIQQANQYDAMRVNAELEYDLRDEDDITPEEEELMDRYLNE